MYGNGLGGELLRKMAAFISGKIGFLSDSVKEWVLA